MRAISNVFFATWIFGLPLYFGYKGWNIAAPIAWAVFVMLLAIVTGWRQPGARVVRSGLIGLGFALFATLFVYYLGFWFS